MSKGYAAIFLIIGMIIDSAIRAAADPQLPISQQVYLLAAKSPSGNAIAINADEDGFVFCSTKAH